MLEYKTINFNNFKTPIVWTVYFVSSLMNGSWSQWSSWQPCSVTCGGGHRTRSRTCSNPAPKWNGVDCAGANISTEFCNLDKCKGRSQKLKRSKAYTPQVSWTVSSNHKVKAVVIVANMKPDVWRGTGRVLASAPIQRQNGTKSIALGQHLK